MALPRSSVRAGGTRYVRGVSFTRGGRVRGAGGGSGSSGG